MPWGFVGGYHLDEHIASESLIRMYTGIARFMASVQLSPSPFPGNFPHIETSWIPILTHFIMKMKVIHSSNTGNHLQEHLVSQPRRPPLTLIQVCYPFIAGQNAVHTQQSYVKNIRVSLCRICV